MVRTFGRIVTWFFLISTIVYMGATMSHVYGLIDLWAFGKNWAADGFCLSYTDTPFWHSHQLCFYADTIAAILLAALFHFTPTKGRSEFDRPRSNVFSTFMHGLAHLGVWFVAPRGKDPLFWILSAAGSAGAIAGFSVFFSSFYRGTWVSLGVPEWKISIMATISGVMSVVMVPPILLFTFVNTMLFLSGITAKLQQPTSDRFHELAAVTMLLFPGVVTWLEPLTCDSFLINWGGHLWFDVSIPLATAVYVCIALTFEPREDQKTEKIA